MVIVITVHNQIFVACPAPVFTGTVFYCQNVLPYKMLIKESESERERRRKRENRPIQPQVDAAKKNLNVQL